MLHIRWYGHACWEVRNDVTIITDPHDGKSIGIPSPTAKGDIILVSHDHYDHNSVKSVEKHNSKIIADSRKKSIYDIEIQGIESFHDEDKGAKRGNNIIFKFIMDQIIFCHLGDVGHELSDEIIKKIGKIDILFIPIGGTFTIDSSQALSIIEEINPKIVIPMHYKIGGLSLPIAGIEDFVEKNEYKLIHVGNEVEIEREDLPKITEIWTFTL
jgi:L-ascorbate metabolism protein UlaG (beta-lactamase superfamily)